MMLSAVESFRMLLMKRRLVHRSSLPLLAALLVGAVVACGGATPPAAAPSAPKTETTQNQIVTDKTTGTAAELRRRADEALLKPDYKAALEPLEALRAAEPSPRVLLDLGAAYEALADRDKAKARYAELQRAYSGTPEARAGLFRQANLAAYGEAWTELATLAETILALSPADDVSKMTGLGARGLARVEQGDDVHGMRDIQDGLDIMEATHYGSSGRLPVAAAQLQFGLAEARRVRSEKIGLAVPTEEFLGKFEVRCAMLLAAQSAFTDAIRSEDARWAAMSGFRVGEMYRVLHRDLMAIPPNKMANTKDKQQLFFSMMHVRYRVLLEKGADMMIRTIALGEKLGDASVWLEKARATKVAIDKAIEDEKATIAQLPYTEAEVQKALDILKKKVELQQEKEQKAREKLPRG